jgi:hypothetical protein
MEMAMPEPGRNGTRDAKEASTIFA